MQRSPVPVRTLLTLSIKCHRHKPRTFCVRDFLIVAQYTAFTRVTVIGLTVCTLTRWRRASL